MNEQSSQHPEGVRLDAIAIGSGDREAREHVAGCAICAKYVEIVANGAATFARNEGSNADKFVRSVRQRARGEARSRAVWAGGAVGVLALAASVALFLRSRQPSDDHRVAMVDNPTEGPVRFKGSIQVAVVVEHQSIQRRETKSVEVVPGDRIRAELALDRDVRVSAGILTESGEWAELQPPAVFGPGTHYTEQSIAFDQDVPTGWLLVGDSEAVTLARKTRDFHDITAMRVRPQKP